MKYADHTDADKVCRSINEIARFCALRSVPALDPASLKAKYGIKKVSVLALFGGSIVAGADTAAKAMLSGAAERFVISGGEGHTTEKLRRQFERLCPEIPTSGQTEAAMFSGYLMHKYGIAADMMETGSTNCGNNVTNVLALLKQNGITAQSIAFIQDAAMQRRMDAGFRKYFSGLLISFPAYTAEFSVQDGVPALAGSLPAGMWPADEYIRLLMGEIPRLRDDKNGYGPCGSNFIAHVDIPSAVLDAYDYLFPIYGTREADPRWMG